MTQDANTLLLNLAKRSLSNYSNIFGSVNTEAEDKTVRLKRDVDELHELLYDISHNIVDGEQAITKFQVARLLACLLHTTFALCAQLKIHPLKVMQQKEARQI